jgi:hypothetical protein
MAFIYLTVAPPAAITVPCTVMRDSGIIEANPETGPIATVKFGCLWQNHYNLVHNLLGLWTGTPPGNVMYTTPAGYPPSPNLVCTSIPSIEPIGKPAIIETNYLGQTVGFPWMTRESVILTAVFTRPPYQPVDGGYFTISFSGGGEFLTIPETTYRFGDGTPTNTPIGILIPQAQITVTRYKMPFIPDVIMMGLLGQLNNDAFQIGYNIYAPGTLMFMNGDTEIQSDTFGNLTYQVQYRFMYRPIDWNWYLHPDRTTGFAPVTDGNGNGPYGYGNFDTLP